MRNFVWFPTENDIQQANVWRLMQRHGLSSYEDLIAWSITDIETFWDAVMNDLAIEWERPYQKVLDLSEGIPWAKWFVGGRTNIVTNCIDRHLLKRGREVALIWESENGISRTISYETLNREVSRLAAALRREGIVASDVIGIYMPMSLEMVFVFYAALKIGAIILPVFSGFAASSLATRLAHAEVKILFTADGTQRRGSVINIKKSADEAVSAVPSIKRVVCLRHYGNEVAWNGRRDIWYSDFIEGRSKIWPTEALDAEATAIILYTSGTTGQPKGTVHSHGGCLAQIGKEVAYHFDFKAGERFFWLTDIGWMMGPWMLIGTHMQGGAALLYDGVPNYPESDHLWDRVDRQKITHLGLSPTAIRVLMRESGQDTPKTGMTSLRILGSTGEPWDDESYHWYFEKIGNSRLPIINISGGTEIIGCFLAPLPITSIKSTSLRGPGLGMDVDVFDDKGKPVRGETGQLVCKQPAPSMTRGFWKEKQLYLNTYWSHWKDVWVSWRLGANRYRRPLVSSRSV